MVSRSASGLFSAAGILHGAGNRIELQTEAVGLGGLLRVFEK